MESSSLDIKLMFGKNLKAFNFFQKLTLYVSVSIVSDNSGKKLKKDQKQRTPPDKEGDGNPEWNHDFRFNLKEIPLEDCDNILVHFEFKHEGGGLMFGDKTIGHVRVPIKDLISEFNGVVRFVDYEVRGNDGKPNGVLTFSYKVNGLKSALFGTNNFPGTQITGFPIPYYDSQPPAPEIQFPKTQYPAYSSPPASLYPKLEPETYSIQQDIQYPSPGRPFAQQESHYYPPPPPACHLQPSAPPQYYPHQPPPQSAMVYGACYPPPGNPAGVNPWVAAVGSHVDYHRVHSDGHVNSFGYGEMPRPPPSSYPYGNNYSHSSSWHGR